MNRPLAAALLLVSSTASAHSSGPPDGRTGAPGEQTCATGGCHSSFGLNAGDVTLQVLDDQSFELGEYAPGALLSLGFRLSSNEAGRARWGFEMTAIDAGEQSVGEFIVGAEVGVQVSPAGQGTYLKQTLAGLGDLQSGGNEWSFLWQAPQVGTGTVTLHACGNAADRSFTIRDDYIECASFELAEIPLTRDSDGDGVADLVDNCASFANADQADGNGDGTGDACDLDWGDVAPAGAPDGTVDVADVIRLLRFAVLLESPADDEEFRRANISPSTITEGPLDLARPTLEEPLAVDVADVILALRASVLLVGFVSPT